MGACLADLEGLTDAEDGGQAVLVGCLDLCCAQLVAFVVVGAALGVADEHEGCAELGEECAGDFAGVCAGVVDGEVLATVEDVQLVALDEGLHGADVGEGREDGNFGCGEVKVCVVEGPCELLDEGDCLCVVEVHLPVACDEGLTRHSSLLSFPARYAGRGCCSEFSFSILEGWRHIFTGSARFYAVP